jgi:predicted DNA-binding transcriptional regulator AlpA
MTLQEIFENAPDVNLTINAGQLKNAIDYCITKTRLDLEQQIADASTETYLSRQKVAEMLELDLSTLFRHAQRGYLVPIKIGNKVRYKKSDIERILNKKA